MVWLLLALLACPGPAEGPEACPDLDCQVEWAQQAWTTDPGSVQEFIKAQSDPLARLSLTMAVSQAHPGEARELCALLLQPTDRAYCERQHERPHLQKAPSQTRPPPTRSMQVAELPSPWPSLQPVSVPCPGGEPLQPRCQTEAAMERVGAEDARGAASMCAGIPESTWREECLFQASEAFMARDGVADAARLCLVTTAWRQRCLIHLVRDLSPRAPMGAPGRAEDWAPLLVAIEQMEEGLADEAASAELQRRVWARSLRHSVHSTCMPTGALLGALPAEATPFVRSATMERLWQLERDSAPQRSLDAWALRLDQVLADAQEPTLCPMGATPTDLHEPWLEPEQDEQPLHTVPWDGPISRVLSADASVDARILVLEAAMRDPGEQALPLVREALSHPSPEVRWTAVRALGVLAPTDPALEPLHSDPDPRVRARAERVRELQGRTIRVVEPQAGPPREQGPGGPPGQPPKRDRFSEGGTKSHGGPVGP